MGDAGEGLVDAESRLAERMEEREQEKRKAKQAGKGADPERAWSTALRDARKHDSPNAGWPEAAFSGALGFRLGGPRSYDGILHELPAFGDGRADLTEVLDQVPRKAVVVVEHQQHDSHIMSGDRGVGCRGHGRSASPAHASRA